ncbi:beta-ketoacyl synthase chain length factor [Psychroserpens jangbogonensis]|uniref:beta-ketoacyl synthase chain length factor n=1 Tax=Psychroserpens jangbogonensis TaxID=1484460 RepID=UPI00053F1A53|nr:beta-ketoacyl synthase chain length factor [Psychroserpens jangbogonensis]
MRNCYIHSAVSISAQNTFASEDFLLDVIAHNTKKTQAIYPNFKDFIAPIAARRMQTAVKMGVVTANKALQIAELNQPDAIITGTGMGCITDTEKFLNSIITNNEAYLTPTSFIQSTHNTVCAQIALGLKCNAFNNTYTHGNLSFESTLIDAQLLIQQQEAKHILVGGVDELGTEFVEYVQMMEAKESKGIKVPFSEGATFAVLSSEKKVNAIKLQAITTILEASKEEIILKLEAFLAVNDMDANSIDAIILGNNGDAYDAYYELTATSLFPHAVQIEYKHLIGEFHTASAFAFWLGTKVLQKQHIPKDVLKNSRQNKSIKTVLLYNQFKGKDHSFILLKTC